MEALREETPLGQKGSLLRFIAPEVLTVNGKPSPCECRDEGDTEITCQYCVQANVLLFERQQKKIAFRDRLIERHGIKRTAELLHVTEGTIKQWLGEWKEESQVEQLNPPDGTVDIPKGEPKHITFSPELLGTALRTGKLKAFIRSERITYKQLEQWTGISYGQLRRWVMDHEKISKAEITEILRRFSQ